MRPHIRLVSSFPFYPKACFLTNRFPTGLQAVIPRNGSKSHETHQAAIYPSQAKTARTARTQNDANAEREGSCELWTRESITLYISSFFNTLNMFNIRIYFPFPSCPLSLPCPTSEYPSIYYTRKKSPIWANFESRVLSLPSAPFFASTPSPRTSPYPRHSAHTNKKQRPPSCYQ